MKFRLEIELGNDAMQTKHDIAEALRDVANKHFSHERTKPKADERRIMDVNGNTVGKWEVTD